MTQTHLKRRSDALIARRGGHDLTSPDRLGQWDLVQLVAEGGLTRIYRARPAEAPPDRAAAHAVKTLRPERLDDPQAIGLLLHEALVGRTVSHPHLIPIFQANVSRAPRYLVMPWLEGATLRERVERQQPFDVPFALWIARQVAEALGALHAAGWRHGDIKPSNIFVAPQGHVTLLDLGFARRRHETGSAVDRCVLGTGSYFAPETITSALRADIRSDIYSLGVVLYEVLSGRLPFAGRSLAELAEQHCRATPPDLRRVVPQLPREVTRLVHQMLAKDPLRRPQTPEELVDLLTRLEIATFSQRLSA